MQEYKLISKKGEGTFSEVLKAQSTKTGNYVAIKCMKTHFTSQEQVNQLREIQALKKLSPHPNIIKLLEVLYDEPTGRLALVFELMEMNMYELIKDRKTHLPHGKVRQYFYQLFKAIDHMHQKGIFHRDIKPENVLLLGDTVKLADLGSCKGTYSAHPYTEYISTRWYRPPECLMTDGYYDHKMDIWGAGCVMYEIMTLVPLFPGGTELDMIHKIHNIIGTPSPKVIERFKKHATHIDFNFPEKTGTGLEKLLPHASKECIDLLKLVLTYDPEERITAEQVLKHEYFRDLWEADRQKGFQSSLMSIRLSPRIKQFHQTQASETERNAPILYSDTDRGHHIQQSIKRVPVKKQRQSNSIHQDPSQLPFLNLSLKVEGIFKPPFLHNTSRDDNYKGGLALPPLKPTPSPRVQVDTKVQFGNHNSSPFNFVKKKEDPKKFTSTLLKPSLSNQHLFKKSKKTDMVFRTPNYDLMLGKIS